MNKYIPAQQSELIKPTPMVLRGNFIHYQWHSGINMPNGAPNILMVFKTLSNLLRLMPCVIKDGGSQLINVYCTNIHGNQHAGTQITRFNTPVKATLNTVFNAAWLRCFHNKSAAVFLLRDARCLLQWPVQPSLPDNARAIPASGEIFREVSLQAR